MITMMTTLKIVLIFNMLTILPIKSASWCPARQHCVMHRTYSSSGLIINVKKNCSLPVHHNTDTSFSAYPSFCMALNSGLHIELTYELLRPSISEVFNTTLDCHGEIKYHVNILQHTSSRSIKALIIQ